MSKRFNLEASPFVSFDVTGVNYFITISLDNAYDEDILKLSLGELTPDCSRKNVRIVYVNTRGQVDDLVKTLIEHYSEIWEKNVE